MAASPNFLEGIKIYSTSEKNQKQEEKRLVPLTFMEASEPDAFLFTVVASALFCLCCRYWAFCFQICKQISA
jgi:hypothetical protein